MFNTPDPRKVIGIVGGMGPQAGGALFNNITSHTLARADQEHLSVILMSFPSNMADRTLFLDGKESLNPAAGITQVIRKLEHAGAEVVGIACNTSHSPRIYDVVCEELLRCQSKVNLVHMPQETCRYISHQPGHLRRIGMLTTNGTYRSGIYRHILEEWGYEVVLPSLEFQHHYIHRAIYDPVFGIKANPAGITREARLMVSHAIEYFKEQRADAVVLGCTELSLVCRQDLPDSILIIDALDILAQALVREALSGTD
ncbi:aspartate/glutamate racemase family protein [Chitinophaga rhizophila]|uniref:Amino acid racemase n=1 Tax=Chitinophaga rhizophila TaxID=2866212 RepID=A0ABS7GIR8_9BACT|nr:amino acid racemase [Chitinophaga rhizophila]MBW8687211.1 amino acid racemase [Chitinophaga rhizophila]